VPATIEVSAKSWIDEFEASFIEPVCVDVCEKFAPDYPSTEGGFSVHIASKDEMAELMDSLRDEFYEVGEPWYNWSWTQKRADGFKHWSVNVYWCAPEDE